MNLDDVKTTLAIARTGATVDDRTWHASCEWLYSEVDRLRHWHALAHDEIKVAKEESEEAWVNECLKHRERAEKAEKALAELQAERAEACLALCGRIDAPLPGKLPTVAREVVRQLLERAEKAGKACAAMRAALAHVTHGPQCAARPSTVVDTPTFRWVGGPCSCGRTAALADDAGKDYVHRDTLMKVAERVLVEALGAAANGADYCECVEEIGYIDLAALVKEVAS